LRSRSCSPASRRHAVAPRVCGKPRRRKTETMQPMPPSRRNLFAWVAGAVALAGGAGWLRALTSAYHDGPVTDHFDGARFHDPHGAAPKGALDMLRWLASGRSEKWPEWAPSPYADRPPARVAGTALRIGFVGHASLLIQSGGLN